jgi:hypothetical protein
MYTAHTEIDRKEFMGKGPSQQEAVQSIQDRIDFVLNAQRKVTGSSTIDFNVKFATDLLADPKQTFYAKLENINGEPKLVIASPEVASDPELLAAGDFKRSALRNQPDDSGRATPLPGIPLTAKGLRSGDWIANGRYTVGKETQDRDGNRVFDLTYHSTAHTKSDKLRLNQPAFTLGTAREVDEHGGGIGPRQRWQDLMPEQMNPEDYEDEDEDEDLRLRSGDYVRDTMDGEHGEVFRMQGDPYERRVRILDRDGKGWYIEPSRLTRVDPTDPDVQRYFGKRRVRDMDEMDKSQPSHERHGDRPLGAKGTTAKPVAAQKVVKDLAMDLDQAFAKQKPVKKKGVAEAEGEYKVYYMTAEDHKLMGRYASREEAEQRLNQLQSEYPDNKFIIWTNSKQGVAEGLTDTLKFAWRELKTNVVDFVANAVGLPNDQRREVFVRAGNEFSNEVIELLANHPARDKLIPMVREIGGYMAKARTLEELKSLLDKAGLFLADVDAGKFDPPVAKTLPSYRDNQDVEEGWSDAMVARRTGTPRTPYSVYIKGRKWKDFENDDHAEAVANKLRAKFKADGRDPSVITVAPTDIPEGAGEEQLNEFLPVLAAIGGALARGAVGAGAAVGRGIASAGVRSKIASELDDEETNEEKTRLDPKCWTGKKIGNPKTKVKGGVRVNNCVPAESITEEQDSSGVERAILNRIMVAHTDLLKQFGPEKVMQAAEEVAYNVGDVDEIGSSDVSAYVHQVKQILGTE